MRPRRLKVKCINWQPASPEKLVYALAFFLVTVFLLIGKAHAAARNNAPRNEFTPPPNNRNYSPPKRSSGDLLNGDDLGREQGAPRNSRPANSASQKNELADDEGDTGKPSGDSKSVRQFHEVLDELLAEFGYDVKMGQLNTLKNVAIRKVEVSEDLPKTYERYIELLVEERVREMSQVKLINCLPCRTRSSVLVDGKLKITSPAHNVGQLNTAAEQLGIDNFMDVILVYHTTHMVLAFQVFNANTKELTWARAYNSETIKSRFQKLAVDYSQVAKARVSTEYVPEYKFLLGVGAASIPNVSQDANDRTMANIQIRAAERFNNRKSDFGLMLSILASSSTFVKDYPAADDSASSTETDSTTTSDEVKPAAFKTAFTIYGVYGHTFLGNVESYNKARHGFHVGVGPTLASGYIAATARAGWDVYFGRRFVTSFSVVDLLPTTITIANTTITTPGGPGADIMLSLNL